MHSFITHALIQNWCRILTYKSSSLRLAEENLYVESNFTSFIKQVTYYTTDDRKLTVETIGSYYEMDWGTRRNRANSFIYTQLKDPYDVSELDWNRTITVLPNNAYSACEFTAQFFNEQIVINCLYRLGSHYLSNLV